MIYSAVSDNWARVKMMHAVAHEYLYQTRGSDFRRHVISAGEIFPFDLAAHDSMEKESQIVGMLMAWSVITIESLVNHALAEVINNKALAVMAIEYPAQVTEKLKLGKSARSELSKKVIILSNTFEPDIEVLKLCDDLADIRNSVVHDKPFSFYDLGDGDVEIDYFRSRGEGGSETVRYDALVPFFRKCDQIVSYVAAHTENALCASEEFNFSSLTKG